MKTDAPPLFDWMRQAAAQSLPHFLTQASFQPIASTQEVTDMLKRLGATLHPDDVSRLQQAYVQEMTELWQDMVIGKPPVLEDVRFQSRAWQDSVLHRYVAAAYLIHARYLLALGQVVKAPKRNKQKMIFYIQQVVDAMSPANFLATNPEVQQKLMASQGESLAKGLTNWMHDLQKGRITQTDETAFEVGRNVAVTPGQVIFENALFQLIQYQPVTKEVYERPLLIVPPCINKYYILDLQPHNSLVKFALEQGHQVCLISWVNPEASMGQLTWDDYVEKAVIEAIHIVQAVTRSEQINTLGFCIGGTLLSTALAVLAARGEHPAASLTLLTTLLDFEDAGVLDVFIDEVQIKLREQALGKGGLMSGRELATTFASLRPNDLIWNYVQNSYLKGEEPPAFDLLYWNGDGVNLPGPMFCWYLRHAYLENSLKQPNQLSVAGAKIDLAKISAPAFIYASRDDHIVPWTSAYASLSLLNPKHPRKNQFVLGASGHIAGVINPPAKMKRHYWMHQTVAKNALLSPQMWLDGAQSYPGSWWVEWALFLKKYAGESVRPKKTLGSRAYPPIEPAPGRYVRVAMS